jgi:hypothetical protein
VAAVTASMLSVRHEALLMLDKRGAILETAREISRILKANKLEGAITGGVAVVLHGHVRTTRDVDVYVADPEAAHRALTAAGYRWDKKAREFDKEGIPVQLVTGELIERPPVRPVEIEHIRTVRLADLINIKLRSGLSSILRAQDLADVIGLMRHHKLSGAFAARVDKEFRAEFKKLLKALRSR